MISVQDAQKKVMEHIAPLESVTTPIQSALGFSLSESVYAPIDLPPFDSSAMDGYAVNMEGYVSSQFKIIGEIQAGSLGDITINPGQAVRIFTGALVPQSASTVIMQESTSVENDILTIEDPIVPNKNIRRAGEQIRSGQEALKKGTSITAAGIGFLASLGVQEVNVVRKPKIGLLVTGNELIAAGNELDPGQIFESNSATLIAAAEESGYELQWAERAADTLAETKEKLSLLMTHCDLVLVSGGISVGDYDFVGTAMEELAVHEVFYKVKQKPGKPLFFGKKGETACFALPGNPASALSCFYHYALPALRIMSGKPNPFLEVQKLPCFNTFIKKGNRAQFLKAIATPDSVEILEGQGSGMLHSFAIANAMVFLDEDSGNVASGDLVSVHLLP